ncbi:hypothetical protein LQZ24_01105 [Fructobacillus sp. M1-13]|uniref:Sugar specific permease n=1 Tax=Fructobacillus papyriferae TaxID=2713171 RepID=A0ABS5QNL0_9LACO|nr:hypothetical protein [Fructobacillus papyriferae]MBS9334635.1 hypothetical protein [Fructobacillus papyriferae]MCD2158625.1 hypothetical protein [Fructobacillus papyriferae]
MKNTIRVRIFFFLFGLILVAFGNALTIVSGAGNGLWTAAALGLAQLFGQPFALLWFWLGLLVILVNALLSRSLSWVNLVGEFSFVLFFSQLIHLFVTVLKQEWPIESVLSYAFRVMFVIFGIVLVCLGTSFYQRANLWMYPTDSLTDILAFKFFSGNPFKGQLLAFVPAVLLIVLTYLKTGDWVGIQLGTLLALFFNGPLIAFFHRHACPSLKHN